MNSFDIISQDHEIINLHNNYYINIPEFEKDLRYFKEISLDFLKKCIMYLKGTTELDRSSLRKMKEDLQFVRKILEKIKHLCVYFKLELFDLKLNTTICIKIIDIFIDASYFLVKNDCNVN
jgi:hypothetical protein